MKARQAKKILRQQPENDLPLHKDTTNASTHATG